MLSVFEKIEQNANVSTDADDGSVLVPFVCKPNEQSYSLLLEAMVDSDDFRVFDDVLTYMDQSAVQTNSRVLRRLIFSFVKQDKEQQANRIVDLLQQREGRPMSRHVRARMSQIRLNQSKSSVCEENSVVGLQQKE